MGTDARRQDGAGARAGVTHVALRIPARLTERSLAVGLVSALAAHVKDADAAFRDAVTTAFGEAFNNVAIHAYKGRSDGTLDLEAEVSADGLTLKLSDTGASADFTAVPEPDLDGLPEGGLGVFMMHSLMDEVVYRAGSPNVLSLTKRTGR